jgi:predicted HicB family RNase H-like nuclease
MFDDNPFDDGRGRYPDRISAQVPRGFRRVVNAAAEKEGISVAEFARRALERELSKLADGKPKMGAC